MGISTFLAKKIKNIGNGETLSRFSALPNRMNGKSTKLGPAVVAKGVSPSEPGIVAPYLPLQ
jgi:hypothetical protein